MLNVSKSINLLEGLSFSDVSKGLKHQDSIKLVQIVFFNALEAVIAFQQRRLELFDALVGDQACQIRALYLAELVRSSYPEFTADLITLNEASISADLATDRNEAFDSVQVEEKTFRLIQMYLLGKTRKIEIQNAEGSEVRYREKTSQFLLSKNGEKLSKALSKPCADILDIAKRQLRSFSVSYIEMLSERYSLPLKGNRVKNKKGEDELPFFSLTKVVFTAAAKEQIPLYLKMRRLNSVPKNPASYEFNKIYSADCKLQGPHLIIEGVSQEMTPIDDLFLAIDLNAADHPQYVHAAECELGEINNDIQVLREEAKIKGFSQSNPQKLAIEHVYCGIAKGGLNE